MTFSKIGTFIRNIMTKLANFDQISHYDDTSRISMITRGLYTLYWKTLWSGFLWDTMGWLISKLKCISSRKKAQSHKIPLNFLEQVFLKNGHCHFGITYMQKLKRIFLKTIEPSTIWQTLNKGYYTVIYRIDQSTKCIMLSFDKTREFFLLCLGQHIIIFSKGNGTMKCPW